MHVFHRRKRKGASRRLPELSVGGIYSPLWRDGSERGGQPSVARPGFGFAHRIFHPAHGALLDGDGTGRRYRLCPFDRREGEGAEYRPLPPTGQADRPESDAYVFQGCGLHESSLPHGAVFGTARLPSRMDCTFAGAGGCNDSGRLEKVERNGPAGHRSRENDKISDFGNDLSENKIKKWAV